MRRPLSRGGIFLFARGRYEVKYIRVFFAVFQDNTYMVWVTIFYPIHGWHFLFILKKRVYVIKNECCFGKGAFFGEIPQKIRKNGEFFCRNILKKGE